MVDIDRLKDKFSGGDDGEKDNSKSGGGKRKKEKNTSSSGKEKEKTKREKLNQIKGVGSKSGGAKGTTEDLKRLLFCIGNMNMYPRVVKKSSFEGVKKADRSIKKETADDFASEATNFIGVFGIEDIASDYGYSMSQIMDVIANNRDMTGRTMNDNTGEVSKSDIKDCLDCIANVFLYVEGVMRSMEDEEDKNRKQTVKMAIAEAVYKYYKKLISKTEVQKIAEKYGYDWKDDVVEQVLTNQNLEKKIDERY